MEIKDLKIKQGNVDITVDVIEVGEPREFQKFGTSGKVANATIQDATGKCKLTLWNDDVSKVKAGSKIKVTNGYVGEYQGEMQLTSGKFGKIEVVGEADASSSSSAKKSSVAAEADTEDSAGSIDVEEEEVK